MTANFCQDLAKGIMYSSVIPVSPRIFVTKRAKLLPLVGDSSCSENVYWKVHLPRINTRKFEIFIASFISAKEPVYPT